MRTQLAAKIAALPPERRLKVAIRSAILVQRFEAQMRKALATVPPDTRAADMVAHTDAELAREKREEELELGDGPDELI